MNRLVIIGNGFDLAHRLKTSYKDFIDWYWNKRIEAFVGNTTKISEDCLCKLAIDDDADVTCWNVFAFENSYFKDFRSNNTCFGYEVIKKKILNHPELFSFDCTPFFKSILLSIETKGWVDIENEYYHFLKKCSRNNISGYASKELNRQFNYLQEKLVEYLCTIDTPKENSIISCALNDDIKVEDLSIEGKNLAKAMGNITYNSDTFDDSRYLEERFSGLRPNHTMLLCFNYTATAMIYEQHGGFLLNYIHGELNHPEHIIFGYGDELDVDYKSILEKNDNELMKNIKSIKYLETSNYHKMLDFIMAAPFQVLIMGHSCGNSDRTLLNTVFEHKNCISIKPYYHERENGGDNYLDLVQNILRNFTNMQLFRDRVVNKEQCQRM
ncbi:MAG: hypothetical protein KBT27_12205 [Prevotellaceae bacterium]|nr:hypothetical protein [Candidatus Faecinaster equi]